MTVNTQKPIVIFRGDNTAAFDLRTIRILLTGDLDLTNATARFDLLDFTKSWTTEEVATGELSIVFDSAQTKSFALGPQVGTLRLYDMSTGTPRQLTIVNKIPFFVTNRVCEIDSQSYEADVCVSGGDVIHIEFKVGAGAVEGKADKVKNATAGDLASLTVDGNLEDSGIPKTDVLRKSQMDSTPTAGSQNPVTSDGIKQAIDAATPSDYAQVKEQVAANTGDIAEIEGLIPAQASAQNQLADKAFVNSSIATNTATFRGSYNLVSDLGLTVSATEQQVAAAIATKLASLSITPENNDYCFVQVPKTDADPTVIERIDRYKCTVTESGGVTTRVWEYEWSLNNSSFTADQWAAINSGVTAADVTKLAGIEAGAQVNAVASVNSKTGAVVLSASDVGALGNSGAQSLAGALTQFASGGLVQTLNASYDEVGFRCYNGSNYSIKYLHDGIAVSTDSETTWRKLSTPSVAGTLALLQNLAPDFSTSATYAVGQLCVYSGTLYRCTTAITTAEVWTAAHWTEATVEDVLVTYLPLTGGTMTGNLYIAKNPYNIGEVFPLYPDQYGRMFRFCESNAGIKAIISGGDINIDRFEFWGGYGDDQSVLSGPCSSLTPDGSVVITAKKVASSFDRNTTYKPGDLVIRYDESATPYDQSEHLYCCTAEHTGSWDSSHFTSVGGLIQIALALKAPLASPAFTGTPTAPTPTSGDNSTKVATTAFVKTAVDNAQPNLDYVMRVDPQTGNIYYTTPDANANA